MKTRLTKELWHTRWGVLHLQSEHAHYEQRLYFPEWHSTAEHFHAPKLPDASTDKRVVQRRIQRWVDANGGEKVTRDEIMAHPEYKGRNVPTPDITPPAITVTCAAFGGMVHEGCTVLVQGRPAVVLGDPSDGMVTCVKYDGSVSTHKVTDLEVRLNTRTGQSHVGWWIADNFHATGWESYHDFDDRLGQGHYHAAVGATQGDFLDDDDAVKLRACVGAVRDAIDGNPPGQSDGRGRSATIEIDPDSAPDWGDRGTR